MSIILKKFHIPAGPGESFELLCGNSLRELLALQKAHSSGNDPWGYFPGIPCMEEGEKEKFLYPATLRFSSRLISLTRTHNLIFIKAAPGPVEKRMEGFHLDQGGTRLLLNLAAHPRIFLWSSVTKDDLIRQGVHLISQGYQVLDQWIAPSQIQKTLIPGRCREWVFGLQFPSSQLPHRGISDEKKGHFLACFSGK